MEDRNEKVIDKLNYLIKICNDGKYGYEKAAENADSPTLKSMFLEYAVQRSGYAHALRSKVIELGGNPDDGGELLGAMHRAWIDIKTALTSKDNKAVLGACITGDTGAVKAYDEALENPGLPSEIRTLLSDQRRGVEEALSRVRSLHETVES